MASRQALREATQVSELSNASSDADLALRSIVTPVPVEKLIESLIDNRLLLMTQMEHDLTARASTIADLLSRIHILTLNIILNQSLSDIAQMIPQHNELVNLYHQELFQHQKKHAEYETMIEQIHLLSLYFNKQKDRLQEATLRLNLPDSPNGHKRGSFGQLRVPPFHW